MLITSNPCHSSIEWLSRIIRSTDLTPYNVKHLKTIVLLLMDTLSRKKSGMDPICYWLKTGKLDLLVILTVFYNCIVESNPEQAGKQL